MEINVRQGLNSFLSDRKDRFPNVTENQKNEWVKEIEEALVECVDDNDIYYDHKPDNVKEIDEEVEDEDEL
jgi:hypothetical protein